MERTNAKVNTQASFSTLPHGHKHVLFAACCAALLDPCLSDIVELYSSFSHLWLVYCV